MTRLLRSFLVLLLVLLVRAALAIDIFVRSPRDNAVVFGHVEVDLEVLSSAPVARVEIRLDGETAARLSQPPYRTIVDVGLENRSHTFEITAVDVEGNAVTRTIVTGRVEVHLELELELQQLYVTATRNGRRVLDLEADDFEILDDDRRQQKVTFERGDIPLTAALLIDSSLSMRGDALRAALAGARAFVQEMRPLDLAKVIVFSDRLLASTPFTSDPAVVSSVMDTVEAGGGTAINDHLYWALKELDRQQGRRVIVLLSDGLDIESVLDMGDVEWKASRAQSLIYWVRPTAGNDLDVGHFSIWRDEEAYRREIATLKRVVHSSGGRIREIERIDTIAEAFAEILQELRDQYVLGYYPDNNRNDGAWHKVRLRVRSPGVQVRARAGYFDEPL